MNPSVQLQCNNSVTFQRMVLNVITVYTRFFLEEMTQKKLSTLLMIFIAYLKSSIVSQLNIFPAFIQVAE